MLINESPASKAGARDTSPQITRDLAVRRKLPSQPLGMALPLEYITRNMDFGFKFNHSTGQTALLNPFDIFRFQPAIFPGVPLVKLFL